MAKKKKLCQHVARARARARSTSGHSGTKAGRHKSTWTHTNGVPPNRNESRLPCERAAAKHVSKPLTSFWRKRSKHDFPQAPLPLAADADDAQAQQAQQAAAVPAAATAATAMMTTSSSVKPSSSCRPMEKSKGGRQRFSILFHRGGKTMITVQPPGGVFVSPTGIRTRVHAGLCFGKLTDSSTSGTQLNVHRPSSSSNQSPVFWS